MKVFEKIMLILGGIILVPTTALIGFILYSEASGITPNPIELPAWMKAKDAEEKEQISANQISDNQDGATAAGNADIDGALSDNQTLDQSVSTNQTIQMIYTNETTPAATVSGDEPADYDAGMDSETEQVSTEDSLADTPIDDTMQSGEDESMQVWVNEDRKYYHNVQSCKDTHNSSTITLKEAKNMGYKQCPDCWQD